jgi:hypothetical protein
VTPIPDAHRVMDHPLGGLPLSRHKD